MKTITDQEFLILLARHLHKEAKTFGELAQDYSTMPTEGVRPEAVIRRSEVALGFRTKKALMDGLFGKVCHQLAANGVQWEIEGSTLVDQYEGIPE